jgi:hypothetical protein
VRTAVISDLHLGTTHGEDVVRDPAIRRVLLEGIADADRLLLLGDVLELRELPMATVLEVSRPFFEELGEAMAGRQVVLVPGNHDHRLAEPLLEQVELSGPPALGLEQHGPPPQGWAPSGATATIADWLGKAELDIAYPGIWLREDVYATHGHYMDCHMTLPRVECLAAATVMRLFGEVPDSATPADYERVLQPIYGLADGLVSAGVGRSQTVRRTRPSEIAWQAIAERGRRTGRIQRAATRAAIGVGIPAGVWTLNRLLRADFDPNLSAAAITQSGIAAAVEMARRLEVDGVHVLTGHTHRGGPNEDEAEWALPGGGRLHNTGSWVFASAFHLPGRPPGPYWPGTVTWVADEGAPTRVRLLEAHAHEDLRATVRRSLSR